MIDFPIDFVFPYVDNHEQVWRETYINYCKQHGLQSKIDIIDGPRFDDIGFLKYVFRGISKFMPWIRTVHIIVSNEEQVPKWVDESKINIVKHLDIIPQNYLPTFNSTTIEMFLNKIPNLAEHFIYSNDDVYPLQMMNPEDFFDEQGNPKLQMVKKSIRPIMAQFPQVCCRCWKDISLKLGRHPNTYDYMRPSHGMAPMLRSSCTETIKILGNNLYKSISNFRSENNYNQYIYSDYNYLTGKYSKSDLKFIYSSMEKKVNEISQIIRSKQYQVGCFNYAATTDVNLWNANKFMIENAFSDIGLSEKCKYEI